MSTPPPASVLLRAAQVSMTEDRPIYLDYFQDSLEKKCCIGVQDTTKYLVKSDSEYTSTITAVFKCDNCFVIETENSLYIVSAEVPVRRISPTQPSTQST